jgi:hypothetical protein
MELLCAGVESDRLRTTIGSWKSDENVPIPSCPGAAHHKGPCGRHAPGRRFLPHAWIISLSAAVGSLPDVYGSWADGCNLCLAATTPQRFRWQGPP